MLYLRLRRSIGKFAIAFHCCIIYALFTCFVDMNWIQMMFSRIQILENDYSALHYHPIERKSL